MTKINSSDITPEHVYLSRRRFMVGAGGAAAGALLSACGVREPAPAPATATDATPTQTIASTDELGEALTPYETITTYNNYYEFVFNKQAVAGSAREFKTSPWTIQVGGLVNNPKTFDLDALRQFAQEERIYRLRCVEAWSMVIPWLGFPLASMLKEVEPKSNAMFVRFESLYDPEQMPNQKNQPSYKWPYVEGLRLDEAMHDLTLLATGLYGKPLPPQDGAPIRLIVPWKYGFKSLKAIVKIDLVADMPTSFWMDAGPDEYGFYANVNPNVPHPRWSQATERRIGESRVIKTLLFNGYAEQVAHLYDGMDLTEYF